MFWFVLHHKDNKLLSIYRNIKSQDDFNTMERVTYNRDKESVNLKGYTVFGKKKKHQTFKKWYGETESNTAYITQHLLGT